LDYIDSLLKIDVRNNSAWNMRYFVVHHTKEKNAKTKREELEYAQKWIAKAPNNESPWVYIKG